MNNHLITLAIDGCCKSNPGKGGWAAVFRMKIAEDKTITKVIYGYDLKTTNNRMELTAAIHALERLTSTCGIQIICDSLYVILGMTKWMKTWKKNNFKHGKLKNRDLWMRLDEAQARHPSIDWVWVKRHSNNELN